jgi:hypothetical protein
MGDLGTPDDWARQVEMERRKAQGKKEGATHERSSPHHPRRSTGKATATHGRSNGFDSRLRAGGRPLEISAGTPRLGL